jgi:hypothetical protein
MMSSLTRGAGAGLLATVPMSICMLALHRVLPNERDMDLAPVEVTEGVAETVGLRQHIPADLMSPTVAAAHFGYGAAGGVLYWLLTRSGASARIVLGLVFGLGVWAASYLGYLPALGIRRSATEDPPERTTTMVAAHLVWGFFLALAALAFDKSGRSPVARPKR